MSSTILSPRQQRIRCVWSQRQSGIIVVLEDIHDPHNSAAIFRTCDAFGIQEVYLVFVEEKHYNPRKIGASSSSSANKWLNFTRFDSTSACIDQLRQNDFTVVATTLSSASDSLFATDFTYDKIALLFGNEHRGLSVEACNRSDKKIIIPMSGMTQSLNVSVTAAICIFETMRQRRQTGENYLLSTAKQRNLTADFLQR